LPSAKNKSPMKQTKRKFMKASKTKPAKTPQAPVFQVTIRKRGADAKAAAPDPKPKKRDKIFSKSRDTREDRGTREMKTKHDSQTFFHACALL